MFGLAEAINHRHKALAYSGNDQCGKAEQLDVTQGAVEQRRAHHGLFKTYGRGLGEEKEPAEDCLDQKPAKRRDDEEFVRVARPHGLSGTLEDNDDEEDDRGDVGCGRNSSEVERKRAMRKQIAAEAEDN